MSRGMVILAGNGGMTLPHGTCKGISRKNKEDMTSHFLRKVIGYYLIITVDILLVWRTEEFLATFFDILPCIGTKHI